MAGNKRPRKRVGHHKSTAAKAVIGLQFSWHNVDPLGDVEQGKDSFTLDSATHRKPLLRGNTQSIISKFGPYIFNTVFKWQVDIDAVCSDGTQEYYKGVVVTARCKFGQLTDHLHEQTEEVFNSLNMKHYKHMKYTAECIGR